MCIIEDYDNKMSYLKQMFPSKGEPEISKALMDVKGDQETAFDILMGAGRYKMGVVKRKPVFGFSNQVPHKSSCTAETLTFGFRK